MKHGYHHGKENPYCWKTRWSRHPHRDYVRRGTTNDAPIITVGSKLRWQVYCDSLKVCSLSHPSASHSPLMNLGFERLQINGFLILEKRPQLPHKAGVVADAAGDMWGKLSTWPW